MKPVKISIGPETSLRARLLLFGPENQLRMLSNYAFVKEVGADSELALRYAHRCHPSLSVFEARRKAYIQFQKTKPS